MDSPDPIGFVAVSPAMREVVEQVRRAAGSRRGVLIIGERGSGRRMVARAINGHEALSTPFAVVDCAGGVEADLQVDLFGSRAPASSPSGPGEGQAGIERISKASQLHNARGGTLFLENLIDMPAIVQTRLARLLRDGEVILAEDHRRVEMNVRPVASVEPSYEVAVNDGRVRSDLHKRISTIRFDVPPLRQRLEDIPPLANSFLEAACRVRQVPQKKFEASVLTLLTALPWRGNVPELRDLVEGLLLLVPGPVIRLEDLLANIRLDSARAPVFVGSRLREARRRFERDYIAAALEQHHWRIGEAAVSLGMERANLYRKMKALRVERLADRST